MRRSTPASVRSRASASDADRIIRRGPRPSGSSRSVDLRPSARRYATLPNGRPAQSTRDESYVSPNTNRAAHVVGRGSLLGSIDDVKTIVAESSVDADVGVTAHSRTTET